MLKRMEASLSNLEHRMNAEHDPKSPCNLRKVVPNLEEKHDDAQIDKKWNLHEEGDQLSSQGGNQIKPSCTFWATVPTLKSSYTPPFTPKVALYMLTYLTHLGSNLYT